MTQNGRQRMVDIPENLIKFKVNTWWLWKTGARAIPVLCLGFVRKTKAKTEGFKLTFVWLNNDGVLVKAHPKFPAELEPIPFGSGGFDWEPAEHTGKGYRPFKSAEEFQPFAEYWIQVKGSPVVRYKVVHITDTGVSLGLGIDLIWDELFRNYEFVAGPWKLVGVKLRR